MDILPTVALLITHPVCIIVRGRIHVQFTYDSVYESMDVRFAAKGIPQVNS
jgi:hypothetical protein